MDIQIIDPLEYPGWNDLLLTSNKTSFFHTSSWARVLCESYKYKPLYFTLISNGELSALIPIMELRSSLTGKRGISLPFTDYCQPIINDRSHHKEIIDNIIDYGQRAGWKYIEWRDGEGFLRNVPHFSYYYGHILELKQNEQELLSCFRSSTRRNIKKAIKEGVSVKKSDTLESVKAFYRLNCITRKHHGLPPQPYYFFKKLFEHVLRKKEGFVILASFQEKIIAGAVFSHFGDKAIYKYGASDRNFQHLRPNNLVMWEAIKWYSKNGYRSFSFGRTEPEHKGLLQFKQGWGTDETSIKYYRYDLKKALFMNQPFRLTGFCSKIFNIIPIPALKLIGLVSYRHIG